MSRAELNTWRTWLIVTGVGAVLVLFLPVQVLLLLMLVGVGLLLMYVPAAFMYLLGTFVLSALISLFAPKRPGLRLAVSVVVVAAVANLVATAFNAPVDKAFAQIAAEDVKLTAPPSISRIVMVDDRTETGNRAIRDDDSRSPCQSDACIPYLMNGQA
jgi:hypothetical protein